MPEQLASVNGSHQRRGYDLSKYGSYICYHYFIGTDGNIQHPRPESDRTMCTRNNEINMNSLQIVLAGSFDTDIPSAKQVASLKMLIRSLQKKYGIKPSNILGHKEVSPTACPGKNIMKIIHAERKRLRAFIVPPAIPSWK